MRARYPTLFAAFTGAAAAPAVANAAELTVNVEIPRLDVAEYHRPYVALWIEGPDQAAVKTLAVWYDVKKPKHEGATWLKDMRTWWRKAGRSLNLPADGVSGPTKAPGKHQVSFGAAQMNGIGPGQYSLVVEAAREVGGREVVRVPFAWPAKGGPKSASASGSSELGAVVVTAKP
jgi:Predicted periplasmic protein